MQPYEFWALIITAVLVYFFISITVVILINESGVIGTTRPIDFTAVLLVWPIILLLMGIVATWSWLRGEFPK